MVNRVCGALVLPVVLVACSGSDGGDAGGGAGTCSVETLEAGGSLGGKTFQDWTAEWWRWFFGTPGAMHPFLDESGQNCAVGQDPASPVFFLAGAVSDGAPTRTCALPSDKAILFGIQHGTIDNACLPADETQSADALRADCQEYVDAIDPASVQATLDGCALGAAAYRQDPHAFAYTVPPGDNFYAAVGIPDCSGEVDPSLTGGYWVMLQPLSAGTHQLDWSSKVGGMYDYSTKVHYTLQVE